jgi:hypothetical protein
MYSCGFIVAISLNFRCSRKRVINYQSKFIIVSSGKYVSKADLLLSIKQASPLLNGKYHDGTKAKFATDFKFTRYAIILLAAISVSTFEYHTKKIQNDTFVSFYRLHSVARVLGVKFERTKSAPYAYKELVDRGQVKMVTEDNRTYVTLTDRGKKSCKEKLEELQLLNEHFNRNPLERLKYREKEDWRGLPAKGMAPGSRQELLVETEIDKLIKKISQW